MHVTIIIEEETMNLGGRRNWIGREGGKDTNAVPLYEVLKNIMKSV